MSRFAVSLFALIVATSYVLAAQDAPLHPSQASTPTIHVSTQLVVLDVAVTDKKGNLITRPLAKGDFAIQDDGVEQTVLDFETPDQHQMPRPGQAVVHSATDLNKIGNAPVTILVLDELNNRFEDMSYARQMLEKYLKSQPAILPSPAVLMVAQPTTFQQLHDYTQDRDQLLMALKMHKPQFPWKANSRTGPAAVERIAQVLGALQQIAESSKGTPGRKNLIWIGSGFPSVDLSVADLDTAQQLENAIRRVTSRLLDARVTMYTIDPTLASTATVYAEDPSDLDLAAAENGGDPFGGSDINFASLAPSNGGVAFTGRNDINNLIVNAIDRGRTYYTLSYRPTEIATTDPNKFRVVRVLMKDKDLRAVTRDGYYPEPAADLNPVIDKTMNVKQERANLQLDISSALTTTIAYNGLIVTAHKAGNGEYAIHVDENGMEWSAGGNNGAGQTEATVAAGWYDSKGKLIGHIVREELYARQQNGSGGNYTLPIIPTPGMARLRIVVRDARNGHMGTVDLTKSERPF